MPRKKKQQSNVPAIVLTLMVDGVPLLAVSSLTKVPLSKDKFTARTTVHPTARPSAIALTLVETAAFLMEDSPQCRLLFADIIALLTIEDTAWGDWNSVLASRVGDDWPF